MIDGVLGGDYIEKINNTHCYYDGVICEYDIVDNQIAIYYANTDSLLVYGAL